MTLEEIKEQISMHDVLEQYGIKVNRNGMCCCPIHGERHPSMKIYQDGYKCFACNRSGDIVKFVEEMEGCDFKQAFKILGGTYKSDMNRTARTASRIRIERKKAEKQRAEESEREFRRILMGTISLCDWWIANEEPFSDDWCYAQTKLPWLWGVYETKYLEGQEVNEIDVFRAYREIRQRFVTV